VYNLENMVKISKQPKKKTTTKRKQ